MSIEELLAGYAAGELSEAERTEVEAVLAGSPRLREQLARYQQLFVVLAAAASEDLDAPADLQARINRQVMVKAYMQMASGLLSGLLGAYGRAIIYYLRLG